MAAHVSGRAPAMLARIAIVGLLCLLPFAGAEARTVYECLRDGRLSLSTVPEPGSRCKPKRVNDRRAKVKNFWGDQGPVRGNLQQRVDRVMAVTIGREMAQVER